MLLTPAERATLIKTAVIRDDFEEVKNLMFDSDIPDEKYADEVVRLVTSSLYTVDDLAGLPDGTTYKATMKKVAELVNADGAAIEAQKDADSPTIIH